MESEFKVPSDLPIDPLPDGDSGDSPIPDARPTPEVESDRSGNERIDDTKQ